MLKRFYSAQSYNALQYSHSSEHAATSHRELVDDLLLWECIQVIELDCGLHAEVSYFFIYRK